MIFARNGSVRTTDGWTFHGQVRDTERTPDNQRKSAIASADVLTAIQSTAKRHERNRAIIEAGLSSADWQALFQALVEAESAYRPHALSPKGAYGLGQLMPATARALGVDRTDVAQNLDGSARYLLAQLARFKDIDKALAAYNAGPHRILEYSGIPPFPETRTYIARVHQIRTRLMNTAAQDRTRRDARADTRSAIAPELKPVGSPRPTHIMERKSRSMAAMQIETLVISNAAEVNRP
ncbi:lytic transglycosylase domain-containing protein [Ruegeria halocynthiae]|uniref:lytic transglycosylase domain-containing protein n=1 Tax=Ruegeria halocynthiae TaxID=985054 RepID=UPI0009E0A025|nr:lytic transglycosylase domain-containing protein [Ruegeria halocynthiae]